MRHTAIIGMVIVQSALSQLPQRDTPGFSSHHPRPISSSVFAYDPKAGFEVGVTDYDYVDMSALWRLVKLHDGIVSMMWRERDLSLPSPMNRPAQRVTRFRYSDSSLNSVYLLPKHIGGSGSAGMDIITAGPNAGRTAAVYTGASSNYFALDSADGQFAVNPLPKFLSEGNVFDPRLTVSPDGSTFWFTGTTSTSDHLVAKSVDGITWTKVDSLMRYAPGKHYWMSLRATPLLVSSPQHLTYVTSLKGMGSLPPIGSAHVDSADVIGYFRSTNAGASWMWTTLLRDGEMLIAGNDTVYVLGENFSQFRAVTDDQHRVHIVLNGYTVKPVGGGNVSNYFYTLYRNSTMPHWRIISDPTFAHIDDYDSSYYQFHGNSIGFSFPTISVNNSGSIVYAAWSQPVTENGKLKLFHNIVQNELYHTRLFSAGGENIVEKVSNSFGGIFVSMPERTNDDVVRLFYLADTSNKYLVIGLHLQIVPWIYREISPTLLSIGSGAVPDRFVLEQNFPNPFNPSTTIRFSLTKRGWVTLSLYDVLGRKVKELVREERSAGIQSVLLDGSTLSSGVYFYTLNTEGFTKTKKMILLR